MYQKFYLTLHRDSKLKLDVMVSITDFGSVRKGSSPLVSTSYASLVQLEEHESSKLRVKGSSPLGGTRREVVMLS